MDIDNYFVKLKTKNKICSKKIKIGFNSHVFEEEKSIKSNRELMRPSCLAFSAIFEKL